MIIDNGVKAEVLEYYGGVIDRCLFGETPSITEIKDDPILGYLANSISEFFIAIISFTIICKNFREHGFFIIV